MFVVRHAQSGAPYLIARHVQAARARGQRRRRPPRASDAGPARHVHHPPLQEGLHQPDGGDRRRRPALARRALADPRADHARRARGARDRAADAAAARASRRWACACSTTCAKACKDCDVVIMLRLQNERMSGALLPSAQEFFKHYGLTRGEARAAPSPTRSSCIPGPMNRGVEIDSAVADGAQCGDPAAGDLRHRGAHGGDEHRGGQLHDSIQITQRPRGRSRRAAATRRGDVYIADGRIARSASRRRAADRVIDANGLVRRARAWSTSRRACASRASSTRRRSNPRWTRRSRAA